MNHVCCWSVLQARRRSLEVCADLPLQDEPASGQRIPETREVPASAYVGSSKKSSKNHRVLDEPASGQRNPETREVYVCFWRLLDPVFLIGATLQIPLCCEALISISQTTPANSSATSTSGAASTEHFPAS